VVPLMQQAGEGKIVHVAVAQHCWVQPAWRLTPPPKARWFGSPNRWLPS